MNAKTAKKTMYALLLAVTLFYAMLYVLEKTVMPEHEATEPAAETQIAEVLPEREIELPNTAETETLEHEATEFDRAYEELLPIYEAVDDGHKVNINDAGIEMALVRAGTFTMGCTPEHEDDCGYFEEPAHQVTISKNFYIGKYPVTQKQWIAVMGKNPSHFKGDGSRPVESVSWQEVQLFILRLNSATGGKYRLPTEAEWEYAARGGAVDSEGYKYAGSDDIDEVAWHNGNSGETTHPVGLKKPNKLGIYDMSGNVGEWVNDWNKREYTNDPQTNPRGPHGPSCSCLSRIIRGGGWPDQTEDSRVFSRGRYGSENGRFYSVGFRLAHPSPMVK